LREDTHTVQIDLETDIRTSMYTSTNFADIVNLVFENSSAFFYLGAYTALRTLGKYVFYLDLSFPVFGINNRKILLTLL
jgi:hypothetical protein